MHDTADGEVDEQITIDFRDNSLHPFASKHKAGATLMCFDFVESKLDLLALYVEAGRVMGGRIVSIQYACYQTIYRFCVHPVSRKSPYQRDLSVYSADRKQRPGMVRRVVHFLGLEPDIDL